MSITRRHLVAASALALGGASVAELLGDASGAVKNDVWEWK